jgi:hypothetical protein
MIAPEAALREHRGSQRDGLAVATVNMQPFLSLSEFALSGRAFN